MCIFTQADFQLDRAFQLRFLSAAAGNDPDAADGSVAGNRKKGPGSATEALFRRRYKNCMLPPQHNLSIALPARQHTNTQKRWTIFTFSDKIFNFLCKSLISRSTYPYAHGQIAHKQASNLSCAPVPADRVQSWFAAFRYPAGETP